MLPLSAPVRGRAQGRRNGTRTWGGCTKNRGGGVPPPHRIYRRLCSGFWELTGQPETRQRGGIGRERPPIFDRWRGQSRGGCITRCTTGCTIPPPPLRGGRSRRMYPCRKAPRPTRAPADQPVRGARCVTHSSAPFLSSAASVPWPRGRGRACFPEPIPWPCSSATTRRTCTPPSSLGTTSRRAWPCSSSANSLSARRGSGSPGWASVSGLRSRLPAWPLSPTADGPAIVLREVHPHRLRRRRPRAGTTDPADRRGRRTTGEFAGPDAGAGGRHRPARARRATVQW